MGPLQRSLALGGRPHSRGMASDPDTGRGAIVDGRSSDIAGGFELSDFLFHGEEAESKLVVLCPTDLAVAVGGGGRHRGPAEDGWRRSNARRS